MIRSVIESIKCLSNVTEYTINWDQHDSFLTDIPLVTAGWPAFGRTLQKLCIRCPLHRISSVFPPNILLETLSEIKIYCSIRVAGDVLGLFEKLALCINRHGSTHLNSLGLVLVDAFILPPIDVSPCFDALQFFPLQTLRIQIRFEGLADPSHLARFINKYRGTLRHLALHPRGFSHSHPIPNPEDQRLRQTILHILPIDLLSLELDSNFLSADSVLRCIQPFSNTLTSLVLIGPYGGTTYFTYPEVDTIVSAFAHRPPNDRLTVLMLAIDRFKPLFFDLLSEKLPSLEKLCVMIYYNQVRGVTRSTVDPI